MKEEWKDIVGYNGDYQISNYGLVKSFKNNKEIIMVASKAWKSGHLGVTLCKSGKMKTHIIHQLVAKHFISKKPAGLIVCHDDGNCLNNYVENLRYDTISSNALDAIRDGFTPYQLPPMVGSNHVSAKLNEEKVREIHKMIKQKIRGTVIAKKFNVSVYLISNIKCGKAWKHVK